MNVADQLGLGPTREVERVADGYLIKVTPPAWAGMGTETQTVKLNIEQFSRYNAWRNSGGMIQDYLGDLSPDDAQILLDGIDPRKFDEMFGDE